MASRLKLPRTVLLLGLTSLFTDVAGDMVFPLLPLLLAGMHAGPLFLGVVEGISDAVASVFKYLGGRWSDGAPAKKPMVLLGYSIAAVTRPLLGVAGAVWQVVAIRSIDRVGKGVRSAPRDVLLTTAVDSKDVGRAFGFHQAMDHTGAIIGPLLASGLLALGVPLRYVFLAAIVPGILSVISVALVKETPAETSVKTGGAPVSTLPLPPRLKKLIFVLFLFALGNSSDAFLLLRAKQLGVPDPQLPILWVVLHISKMICSWLGGIASDRMPRHRLILAGWGVFAVSYAGFASATAPWHMWALFVFYGLFYGLTEPVEKALIKDFAPAEIRGRAFGVYHAALGAAAIPAGLLMGALWEKESPHVALSLGAAVGLVSAVLLFVLMQTGGKTTRQPG